MGGGTYDPGPVCQFAEDTVGAHGLCIVEETGVHYPFVSTKATVIEVGSSIPPECGDVTLPFPQFLESITVRSNSGQVWGIVSLIPGRPDDLLKVGDEIDLAMEKRYEDNGTTWMSAVIARDGELVWFAGNSDSWPHLFLGPYGVDLEAGQTYCSRDYECGGWLYSIGVTFQGDRIELRHQETGQVGDLTVVLLGAVTQSSCEPGESTSIAGFRTPDAY
jgi:hypothetical protein